MAELEKPDSLAASGCWFESAGVQIHVGADPDFVPAGKAHPALRVTGLDDLAALLAAKGYPVDWDDRLPGIRRCFTRDPFGNRIELMEAAG
ncbi:MULTISPECIES: VOC family protein [Pacificimonas]|nr:MULTISPECIES: glyoxalase [Pacificimonas]